MYTVTVTVTDTSSGFNLMFMTLSILSQHIRESGVCVYVYRPSIYHALDKYAVCANTQTCYVHVCTDRIHVCLCIWWLREIRAPHKTHKRMYMSVWICTYIRVADVLLVELNIIFSQRFSFLK